MEILYSKTRNDFGHFLETYLFLLEGKTLTSFELNKAQTDKMHRLYDVLISREVDPVLFLAKCFTKKTIVRPSDFKGLLLSFKNTLGMYYPIDSFVGMVDDLIGSLKVWSEVRYKYYMSFHTDPRLVVFDPNIRNRLMLNNNPGFSYKQWMRLTATMCLIDKARITMRILGENWIPFLYNNRSENAVSI